MTQSNCNSLMHKLDTCTNKQELDYVMELGSTYKYASDKTKRRWVKKYNEMVKSFEKKD